MKRLISLICVGVLVACGGQLNEELTLQVPGKIIELSPNDWEKVDDPTNFARNYSEKMLSPGHQFNRMVTSGYRIPIITIAILIRQATDATQTTDRMWVTPKAYRAR